jgi:hypothetical protein
MSFFSLSFPRKRGPSKHRPSGYQRADNLYFLYWMPAYAGMTSEFADDQ